MFLKITVIAIIAFVAATDGADVWDGFTAKWAANVGDGFIELPRTLNDAMRGGWTTVSAPKISGLTLRVYADDPRFGLYFGTRGGKVMGHQIALPVADIKKSGVPIDYSANPAITVKTLNGRDYYTATAMYKDDKAAGVRQIWLERNGELEEIPTKSELVLSETPYYSKRCIERMGHHFYQINSTSDVSSVFPWFLLSVEDEVVGIGFQAIGTVSSAPKRRWFETIPATQIAETIPDAPAEIGEAIVEYGLISFHVWFKKNPLAIQCSDECTAVYNGTETSSGSRTTRRRRATGSANVC